ncbi:hypothetical protein COU57_00210 [Candidatus Pacearchaeota archaeon CG10_big_fil_rev_8_21_14_0_10_32_14]|nr:MAG: hypothetical protein COU57_00210 [Candidatus Pacearchaeota archaeon CG10_big_fil_rev_8_21_14_0_10_32_14]
MNFKEFIKPTWGKVSFSLGIPFLIVLLIRFMKYDYFCKACASGGFDTCINYEKYLIFPTFCNCTCIQLSKVLTQYVWLIASIIILYIIYSGVSYFFRKK